ncbi:hypothetical protein Godav_004967, partial [Gossypium davidsonii]|nr:hypothetical protein [Gossypium davidsonii]
MQPLPKRLKLENPTAPVSYNSEVGVELLPKVLDDSTIANRMGIMNMEVNTELLPYPTEDSTSAKEMNIELLQKILKVLKRWQKVFLVLQRWLSLVIKWWKLMVLAVI